MTSSARARGPEACFDGERGGARVVALIGHLADVVREVVKD